MSGQRRILITGGAGFIGIRLAERLAQYEEHEVLVLDNLYRGRFDDIVARGKSIRFVRGDIRDRVCVREAMQGISAVFHLAAQANVLGAIANPEYSFSTNVWGTVVVLEAACAAGVRRVVFTSSREVYGEASSLPVVETTPLLPGNLYGASKASAEHYCRAFANDGLDVNILRLGNVYGKKDRDRVIPIFLDRALSGRPLVLYGGEQVLDFVWIDTVVDALVRAAFGPVLPGPTNIGSGKGTQLRDLAQRVLQLTGSNSVVKIAPRRSVETTRFIADITLAKRLLKLRSPSDPLFALSELVPACADAARA